MEEVTVVEGVVGGEGAVVAVGDVEEVDKVVFLWFAAAGVEGVDVVGHFWKGEWRREGLGCAWHHHHGRRSWLQLRRHPNERHHGWVGSLDNPLHYAYAG